ncbi:hypothetical protein TRM7557_03274 [Tritonibacter multivorans]|uniref:Uncharacterized protein n=1 Tax=Tritonibacter multivorans TaxID=928856 RepID=A0A0N7M0R1_9RHOB|nr:hypothetical protein TRM7557_03274 [Tritonibacter multivorans]SFC29887.1 hypothetical protein SAMN04488049_102110 [Tritonibacter multivorans]
MPVDWTKPAPTPRPRRRQSDALTELDFGSTGAFELEWLIDWAERPRPSASQPKPPVSNS